uniref:Telomere-associated protein Rif1 N-terminal domain-containing protein n=1 Tax=Fagus sylvatica TaxID=28930 RepID=A0A2N9FV13_FAGSY
MSNSSDQLEEIKLQISSDSRANKCFAYSTLLHFQEQSSDDPASIQALAGLSQSLLSLFVADISDDDEEIAAQALKCLGFMIYHPSLVAVIAVDDANLVIESLVRLVTTTKMKSVCNLGVWCISIQQFNAPFLDSHYNSLLQAVVHAIDNPIGSLSTTFEAIQALIKVNSSFKPEFLRQYHEKGSFSLTLMLALVKDMKQILLTKMKELLDQGMKVQTIHAWGWFIRLLGSYALKNRQLTNEMLKIPENTFSDLNPQVQIASQVAWEGLIDALIHPPIVACETNASKEENGVQQVQKSRENSGKVQANGLFKQHKASNDSSDRHHINKSVRLWNLCLDLLDDFILAKCKDVEYDTSYFASQHLSASKFLRKQYSVKWLPWDICQLDFHLKIIFIFISQASIATVNCEYRSFRCDAALRLFVSVLKGVRLELEKPSTNYNDIMLCLSTVLRFIKKICEDVSSDGSDSNDLHHTCLQFIEAVTQELEPAILESPLYKVSLDLKLLYNYVGPYCLNIWIAIAQGLKDYMDDVKERSLLKMESGSTGSLAICYLLLYPFSVCSCPQKNSTSLVSGFSQKPHVSPQGKLELEHVFEVWKSLYGFPKTSENVYCSAMNSFLEDLYSMLNGCLDEYASKLDCANDLDLSYKDLDLDFLSLFGNVVICSLEEICTSKVGSDESRHKHSGDCKISSGIYGRLRLAARYLKLLCTKLATDPPTGLVVTSRVFSALARVINCLHTKQDILLFVEIMSCPLLQWVSQIEIQDKSTKCQLRLLWAEILNCLRSSQPTIIFDSVLLKLQAPLLEKTLEHPNPSISEPTITFWNSTYGEQTKLDYPQSLLHVLDKLSRNGKINLHKRSLPYLERCHSRLGVITAPQRYRVTATHSLNSKRVEFVEDIVNQLQHEEKLSLRLKRQRLELTEHQKEVRRAQQGRERDCSGHGPGIRTYTSVDFSQGNEDSQESQEIRNPESIMEMLKRAA